MKKQVPRILLEDIVSIQFRRGSEHLFVKTLVIKDFHEIDFLKQSFELKEAESRKAPRGIEQSKKDGIIDKLGDLMPENRRTFWQSLSVNDQRRDLNVYFK